MDYKKIVWLASYPKSGNTWVRMFLDAYYLGEVDINNVVTSVVDGHAGRHMIGDGADPTTLPIDVQQLCRPMALLRLVRNFNANKFADVPLFVKTHNANLLTNGIEWLPECLTKATIHIVRDPISVFPSFQTHMGLTQEQALKKMDDKHNVLSTPGSVAMADFISSWKLHTNSFLNGDTHNIKTFRYEDMKTAPVEAFSEILVHAGVKPEREKVKQALEIVDISKLKAQEEEKGFIESSPHAKNQFFGRKHEEIDQKTVYQILNRYGRVMKRLGYVDRQLHRAKNSSC